ATGYGVRFDDQRVGFEHAAFFGVHVSKNGDPVLDAARIDVSYALRDIFPGGEHRYGFAALSVQRPVLTIVRHADGSYTFAQQRGTGPSPPAPTRRVAAPLFFTARVRDGVIRLVDRAPRQPDLAVQTIEGVAIDASVKSDARTTVRADGVLVGRRMQGGALERFPLTIRTRIDVPRGLAVTRMRAAILPVRGILGYLIHARVVRFDGGVLRAVAASYDGIGTPGEPFNFRLGATFALRDGRLAVSSLERPLRDLGASFVFADGTLATRDLRGSIAETALHGGGALYDLFGTPQFRFALAADPDLARFKTLFAFSRREPLTGGAHVETLLTSKLDDPLIRSAFSIPHAAYERYPIRSLDGVVDYMASAVVIHGARARYGSARLAIGGRILIGERNDDLGFAVAAHGRGAELPYADAVAPDARVTLTALLHEPPGQGFNARGAVIAAGATRGAGTFAVDQYGVGEFGPFAFARGDGSSLAGGFELQRPISSSAGWIRVRGYRIAGLPRALPLPGVQIPEFPPLAGVFDGDVAAGGTPDAFGLSGNVRARDLQVAGMPLGSGSVRVGGSFADVRLADLIVDGPLGRFTGGGGYAHGTFALDGTYDGSLAALAPLTHDPTAAGGVHGRLSTTIADGRIVVQSTGAALHDASIRGVVLDRVAGTMLVDGPALRIIAADGTLAGSHAVAGDVGGPFLVSGAAIPAVALRRTGLPL
ncbi:MAG: hypothetical protein JOZ24_10180, partial [Candidatus Eremiobacteraeota bacterium]|nr:hypothetical protein [Candidatus Eremiobacteraeota bacterium]